MYFIVSSRQPSDPRMMGTRRPPLLAVVVVLALSREVVRTLLTGLLFPLRYDAVRGVVSPSSPATLPPLSVSSASAVTTAPPLAVVIGGSTTKSTLARVSDGTTT
jgi:hypothetical protein